MRHSVSTPALRASVCLVLGLVLAAAAARAAPAPPTPAPFERFAVMMQTGLYDPSAPHPEIPGCFAGACDGYWFQEHVMRRDAAEILAAETEAKAFFRTRFGLDVDDPANAGRLFFFVFMLDPRADYRLYVLGGRRVPSTGWEVRDGGFSVIVLDPAGFTLGGEMAGVHVPAGSMVATGEYNILTTSPAGRPRGELVIRYHSTDPIVPGFDGALLLRCAVEHPRWGSGRAQVVSADLRLPDGRLKANLRNVMTFPEWGDPMP